LTVAEYQYDGNNRRIAKLIYTAGSLDETRHVYYSAQSQALEERIDAATSPEIQFVWNLGYVDDLLMRDRDVNRNGTMNHRAYALTDLRYSMAALSNASGAVIERFAYDAHGQAKALASNFVSRPSSNYDWEFRYTGRRQDLETGLMFFRARYYSTELGRFISRDPLGFVDGMSLYRGYFLPNSVDPLGLGENTWECQKTRFHARYCIGRFTEQIVDVWVEFCKCEKCDGTIRWILNNVDDQGSKTQKNLRCILDYIILTKVPHPRVPGSFNTYHGHDFLDGDGDTEVTHWVAFDDCSTTPDGSDIDEFPEVEDPQW
jgi:RHS repeat-associated protein